MKSTHNAYNQIKDLPFAVVLTHKTEPIILVKFKENSCLDYNDVSQLVELIYMLLKTDFQFIISDCSSNFESLDKETLDIFSDNISLRQAKAHGLIVNELPMRLKTTYFIQLQENIVPTKLFSTNIEAENWFKTEFLK